MRKSICVLVPVGSIVVGVLAGCHHSGDLVGGPPAKPDAAFKEIESKTLQHVARPSAWLISGSAPLTDAQFDELKQWGVRTVLSVDGAYPDVERAEARGMRYAHLPIGYDGIDGEQGARIARAMRDLPRPIYIHCFHGKHRGPAAAAYGLVCLDELSAERGVQFLEQMGTSHGYPGLYGVVGQATKLDAAQIDAASAEFPSRAKVSGLVEAMVTIDRCRESVERIQKAGWTTSPEHLDLDPTHETQRLADLIAGLRDSEAMSGRDPEFREFMTQCADDAIALAQVVAVADRAKAEVTIARVDAACLQCHASYRN